jgi:glutathione S-transferase
MLSGRPLIVAAMLASPAALDEAGPPFIPRTLRPLLRPVARRLTQAFAKKYAMNLDDEAAHTRVMGAALDELRKGLKAGGEFLLGPFTYADIVMSTMLQGVSPVDDRFLELGPATRLAWTRPALATEYADVLAWRDQVYATRRPERQKQAAS